MSRPQIKPITLSSDVQSILGRQLMMPEPAVNAGKLACGEKVVVQLIAAVGIGAELLNFAEEALDGGAVSIKDSAVDRSTLAIEDRLHVGQTLVLPSCPERIAVIGAFNRLGHVDKVDSQTG